MPSTSTKTLRTIITAGTSNSAAGTTTGTAVDLTVRYGGLLTGKVTNGATGPTIAANVTVQVSGDNTNWKTLSGFPVATSLGNNAVTEGSVEIAPGVMYVRVVVDSNTAQAVTCEAFLQELSTI